MVKALTSEVDSQKPIRAAEYVRMSTDSQRYSILNQQALIHAYGYSGAT